MSWTLDPPSWWPCLLALPLFGLCAARWGQRSAATLAGDYGPRAGSLLGAPAWGRTRWLAAACAVGLFALALLRPVAPGRLAQLAPDVVLCVDVSRSMGAGDVAPSRFEALRLQVRSLLDAAVGSRFALVAFAGDAQVVAPLTADRGAVAWLLEELEPGVTPRGGTDLGAAIRAARGALERVQAVGEVLLLTDGEDFGPDAAQAAAGARDAGHRVQAVGYGSAGGGRIVVVDDDGREGFLRDAAGAEVVTRLDAAGLALVAAAGGGGLHRPSESAALASLWRDDWVPHAAGRLVASGAVDVVQRFWWPLLAGAVLWMLRMCLPERRR